MKFSRDKLCDFAIFCLFCENLYRENICKIDRRFAKINPREIFQIVTRVTRDRENVVLLN